MVSQATIIKATLHYCFIQNVLTQLLLAINVPNISNSVNACKSYDGRVPSLCVSFDECPRMLALIKSPSKTKAEIKYLQMLTCGFHLQEPLICCPYYDILVKTVSQEQENNTPMASIIFPTLKPLPPAKRNTTRNPSTPQNPPIPNTIPKEHPNFSLLPSLRECGKTNFMTGDRIIGGHKAQRGSHPWIARIGVTDFENEEFEFGCGGTIINSRYILTASHCISHLEYNSKITTIRVGEHNTTTDEDCEDKEDTGLPCSHFQDYGIADIVPHVNYIGAKGPDDIALIRVDRDIDFTSSVVAPVCLPFWENYGLAEKYNPRNISQFDNQKGMVSGWGVWDGSRWSETEAEVLQEIRLPIVPSKECEKRFDESQLKENVTISVKQMCIGGIPGKGACKGDSGGPFTFYAKYLMDGRWKTNAFQLGIVSFGLKNCARGQVPTVFTRTSAYLEWILDNIRP